MSPTRLLRSLYQGLVPPRVRSRLNVFRLVHYARALGWTAALKLRESEAGFGRDVATKPLDTMWIRGYSHPLHFRRGTSDMWVVYQVFVTRQYDWLPGLPTEPLIVDCGANFGCSAFFFLLRHPGARVIAVEPDPANAELCRRNLAPFGDRARIVQAAIWPEVAVLGISDPGIHEWGYQVRAGSGGDTGVSAVTIPELLTSVGWGHIDLLKIDIEGSEAELFARAMDDWLPKTRAIAIELHGGENNDRFWEALAGYDYELSTCGEITVCTDLRRKPIGTRTSPVG